ncbi:MAG: hypothetical protein IPQ07_08320 [Myxococcales bacterium]|nr:hypothetical protein [Myxococcales bacterium]
MSRRSVSTAAFAVVVLVVGQLAALAHEAAIRHMICPDHGEEIEAITLVGADDHCENAHWVEVEGAGGEHEDCAIVHALRQSSVAPHVALLATVSALLPVVTHAAPTPSTPPRTSRSSPPRSASVTNCLLPPTMRGGSR